jgi:phosphatidylinositol phosphate synthase
MSASQPGTHDLARGDSLVSNRLKEAGRAVLAPVVRAAIALHVTPNTITVLGLLVVVVASVIVGLGGLLAGAAIVAAGSALDAVDGALARATGGGTTFGGFLDSTLDRAGEAILYAGIGAYYLVNTSAPVWPVLAAFLALTGSFMVSYARARAEGIGVGAAVGLAPRPERMALVVAGLALTGLGLPSALIGALWVVAVLTMATTIQRIWHVWRLTGAESRPANRI